MKMHARDRRKWFAANFGNSYFKSHPLINPSGLIGFALPCAAVLIICAAVLMAHAFDQHALPFAIVPLAGLVDINQLRQNKTNWTQQAKEMLEAANAAGGFSEQNRKAYNDLKAKIEANNEMLAKAEAPPSASEAAATPEAELKKIREIGATGENARVVTIIETAKACSLEPAFAERHIKAGTLIEEFRRIAIDERALRAKMEPSVQGPTGVRLELVREEADSRRKGMIGALLNRFEPGRFRWDEKIHDFAFHKAGAQELFEGSRQYVSLSLLDVAKECLAVLGIRWQTKNRTDIASLAFQSTSDFPNILANVANKSLRAGYEMSESQWRLIAARRTASDFKTVSELTLDGSSRLELVPESGEFKHGKLVEGKETWSLATYGKIIAITRQAIINDDLGAFTRTPFLLGQEVAMLEADTVIGIITANGHLADGQDLFEEPTYHKNYISTGAAIAVDSIGALRVKMQLQQSPGGKVLGITPRFLLAPATKGQLAEQYCSPNYQAAESAKINPWAGRLVPIVEARLDATSTTAWYLFAEPNTPNGTVLIYAYLEGQEGPYTENRQGFDVDGVEIKIRHDFAAAAVDYRGAAKQAGA